jgi:hypothetical protein
MKIKSSLVALGILIPCFAQLQSAKAAIVVEDSNFVSSTDQLRRF